MLYNYILLLILLCLSYFWSCKTVKVRRRAPGGRAAAARHWGREEEVSTPLAQPLLHLQSRAFSLRPRSRAPAEGPHPTACPLLAPGCLFPERLWRCTWYRKWRKERAGPNYKLQVGGGYPTRECRQRLVAGREAADGEALLWVTRGC